MNCSSPTVKRVRSRPGPELLSAARSFTQRGWHVLPLVPEQKRPLTKRGLLDASADPSVIEDWWTRWPYANVGLRTGMAFDVLDIDGEQGRGSLEAKAGPEVRHSGPVSRTGRGEHWLFVPSGTANRAGLLPKVDWRGTNGYIVAPPSIHPDGHRYEWAQSPDLPLPEVPDWLTPLLTEWFQREPYKPKPVRIIQTNPYSRNNPSKNIVIDANRLAVIRSDIVEVARAMGFEIRRDGGTRYAIHCPFHDGDNEASLKLYTNDNSFYCYGCGAWGDSKNLSDLRPGGHHA